MLPVVFLSLSGGLRSAPPAWWSGGEIPVVDPNAAQNNHGMVNIGQAKWMVWQALRALESVDPSLANTVSNKLTEEPENPSGGTFPAIVDFDVPNPKTAEWIEKQRAPLMLGQLKAMALPFYNSLNEISPDWVLGEIQLNHNGQATVGTDFWRVSSNSNYTKDGYFPWNPDTTPDVNRLPANIGQLKAVFSLRFETDTDGDDISDLWEIHYGFDPNNPDDRDSDFDGDGLSNYQEFLARTNPRLVDTDGDGVSDSEDTNPSVRDYAETTINGTLRILTPSRP